MEVMVVSKKKTDPSELEASVAGYLRISNPQFPDECQKPKDRVAYVEKLRRTSMESLQAESTRHGDIINVWYDDIEISASGGFLEKRTEFERARLDARQGHVRILYVSSLSRLFLDITQQELWFVEMDKCGVTVHAQELPYQADEASRIFIRQQFGEITEYLATRPETVLRSVLHEKIRQGQWVGRMLSQWGLSYNSSNKGFIFDQDTAGKIISVFEAFVEANGIAERAADTLNRQVLECNPCATRTPWGAEWAGHSVLYQVRCPLYRRCIVYGDTNIEAPHLVPEVVPASLVARADQLLAERQKIYDTISYARRSVGPPATYLGLIRCSSCGNRMRIVKSCDEENHADGRWISWRCSKGYPKGGCSVTFTVRQTRLDALIGKGLMAALAMHGDYNYQSKLEQVGQKRINSNTLTSNVNFETKTEQHLAVADQEMHRLEKVDTSNNLLQMGSSVHPFNDATHQKTFTELQSRVEHVWDAPPQPLYDQERRAFLLDERITIYVAISSRKARHTYNPASTRPTGGPITVLIEIPKLGLVGDHAFNITETEEAYKEARKGRTSPREVSVKNATDPKRPRPRLAGRNDPRIELDK